MDCDLPSQAWKRRGDAECIIGFSPFPEVNRNFLQQGVSRHKVEKENITVGADDVK